MFFIRMDFIKLVIFFLILPINALSFLQEKRAADFYAANNYQESQNIYEELLVNNPFDTNILYNLANVFYRKKEFNKAEKYFKKVNESKTLDNHKKEQSLFNYANCLVQQNLLERALQAYNEVVKLNPKNEKALKNIEIIKKMLEEQKKKEKEDKQKQNKKDKDQQKSDNQNKDKDNSDNNDKSESKEKNQENQDKDKSENDKDQKNKDKPDKNKSDQKNNDQNSKDKKSDQQENQQNNENKNKPHQPNKDDVSSGNQEKGEKNKDSKDNKKENEVDKKNVSNDSKKEQIKQNSQQMQKEQQEQYQEEINAKFDKQEKDLLGALDDIDKQVNKVLMKYKNEINKQDNNGQNNW